MHLSWQRARLTRVTHADAVGSRWAQPSLVCGLGPNQCTEINNPLEWPLCILTPSSVDHGCAPHIAPLRGAPVPGASSRACLCSSTSTLRPTRRRRRQDQVVPGRRQSSGEVVNGGAARPDRGGASWRTVPIFGGCHLEPAAWASIYGATPLIQAHWGASGRVQRSVGGSPCSPPLSAAPRALHLPLSWRTPPSRPPVVGEAWEGSPDPASLRRRSRSLAHGTCSPMHASGAAMARQPFPLDLLSGRGSGGTAASDRGSRGRRRPPRLRPARRRYRVSHHNGGVHAV
jgi:hypothetical protein